MPGLSSADAARRRAEGNGNDAPDETSRRYSQIVVANVCTRFNAILAALLAVIIVVGPFQDGLFGAVLISNTAIGIFQEVRAKRTLDRLALVRAPRARVWRDGAVVTVAVAELVLDDEIELRRGDQVVVDATLSAGQLEVDESLLSGEADPVVKGVGDTVRSGSFVAAGTATVTATGVGASAYAHRLVADARRFTLAASELRDGINAILRGVQWALVPVAALLVTSQLLGHSDLADAVRGCVAGVGSMIPEGLVLLTSVAFAVAVVRLGRRRVLVQELPAVEGLARVDVLCIDKTGTLTAGTIAVTGIEMVADHEQGGADEALAALAAADAEPNPTLAAIAARWPAPPGWEQRAGVAFSSARKWSGGDFGIHGTWVLGAPDVVLASQVTGAAPLLARVGELGGGGARVVVLATSPCPLAGSALPDQLHAVALVVLTEQLRPDVAATVGYFRDQHVAIKVLSGDHPSTVAAVARAAGLDAPGEAVDAASCDDATLAALVGERAAFGRVSPHQKRLMVAALQAQGRVVAMTGDGVNDVLALKEADVGVAMGSGSAAARAVAQLVLLDDSFDALPPVIAEGRRVIANVERVANLFVVKTVYATVIAVLVGLSGVAYPFLPRHLTIVSDLTIGIPAFFLALLPNARPFRPGFVRRVLRFAVPCGSIAALGAMAVYGDAYHHGLPLEQARTAATITLVLVGLWILTVLARPFTPFKAALVAVMAADFAGIVSLAPLRHYFALRPPAGRYPFVIVGVVVIAAAALEVVGRVQRRFAAVS